MTSLPLPLLHQSLPSLTSLLRDLVHIESPSLDKPAVDRLGRRIVQELNALGGDVIVFPEGEAGDHVLCRWGDGPDGILVLFHMDTVFDLGTTEQRPFREEGGKLYGPGVLDMKASIAMLLTVLRLFKESSLWPARPLTALFTSDEELGSLTSRDLIEAEARRAEVVFCLEPALPDGSLKTARKGSGDIELRTKGIAAHAGTDHEKGRSAIEEMAHHILSAQALTDYAMGTTVNVGVVRGGTRGNVVPEEAYALIDFRATELDEVDRLERWADGLKPVVDGTQVAARLVVNRPPMPRDATMRRTFAKAQRIAREIGMELTEGSSGGVSDANFVSPLGVPVLDGLGAVGEGAHSEREFVDVASLPERARLLSALLLNW